MAILPTEIESRRRWMQFSLRTGLIIMTALCVGLSVWIVPLERKRRSVTAIKALGGKVTYRDRMEEPKMSDSFPIGVLRRWLPQDYFDEINNIDFSKTQVTDEGLSNLQGLTSLKRLSLDSTQVSDAGLGYLQGLTHLKNLSLGLK